jgi:N-acetylmuramoyl-L-alanine amidase
LLTRDSDTTLSAKDRIRFANRKKEAKLFISIHCNMSFSPERKGIEIYVNNTRSDLLKIGLDPDKNGNTNDQFILLKPLSQDHFLEESRQFAAILKNQFESVFSEKISMFELPLNMIQNIYMPAILVEVGYLSNPVDLKRLRGDQFLNQISVVVLRAIEKYQEKLTTENSLIERE